ncbi:type VI secretion system baseplate subunit TssG [Arenibaculum pallidiluteum]|uniref:type VI secretion system baseplate subunit TssG n=1 Tax=Arenibaculum pallidiluteum TaxID=2812559 RepID=UPI001A96D0CB|nr:type VI secretion system baseplate subunit TssG [Arenibaculum pallidiluteum]
MADASGTAAAGVTAHSLLPEAGTEAAAGRRLQDLLRDAAAAPEAYDFFALLRRVDALSRPARRLGESLSPAEDPIRIGQVPSTFFAPRAIAEVAEARDAATEGDDDAARIATYFFGLFGPNGPLPPHLTEYAHQRLHNAGDPTFARFADVFHHRLASLLFRAWAVSEPTVSHDRPGEDVFASFVGALAGYGLPALRDRDRMPDLAKLHFAGRLGSHTRNPEGLRAILAGFFAVPVEILEFQPTWVHLPADQRLALGRDRSRGTLGVNATVGSRIHVFHHRFRIRLGPLGLADYERLLPGGPSLELTVPLARNYIGDELDWTVQLVLRAAEVPGITLGQQGRLGWTTWLGRRREESDADDLTLAPLDRG